MAEGLEVSGPPLPVCDRYYTKYYATSAGEDIAVSISIVVGCCEQLNHEVGSLHIFCRLS